jgi:hypothetical protein
LVVDGTVPPKLVATTKATKPQSNITQTQKEQGVDTEIKVV